MKSFTRPPILLLLSTLFPLLTAQAAPLPDTASPSPDFVSGAAPSAPDVLSAPFQPAPTILPAGDGEDVTQRALPADGPSKEAFVQRLQTDMAFTERLINASITKKRWDWMTFLLPIYRAHPKHDKALADFAEGLMWSDLGQHKRAIARFREVIADEPDSLYVRMNLAVLLYQDRQFEAAADQFRKVAADDALDEQSRAAVTQYLAAIQKQQKWRYNLGLNYEHTDNVNNASADQYIWVDGKCLGFGPGMCLKKNEESLPRSANGIRYHANLARDFNIRGNHYLTVGTGLEGVNYWDARDFNEFTWRAEAGYAYRDVKRQFSFTPYIEQMWLSGDKYSRSAGVAADYIYWFSPKWQLLLTTDWSRIKYDDHRNFDGDRLNLAATVAFLPSANTMLFAGADNTRSNARVKIHAYRSYGARLGIVQELPWGISSRLQVRYGEKDYQAPTPLYGYTRHDKEYQGMLTLWHRAVSVAGITPKLNVQYSKIDSNQASFYSRDARRIFLSLEKTF